MCNRHVQTKVQNEADRRVDSLEPQQKEAGVAFGYRLAVSRHRCRAERHHALYWVTSIDSALREKGGSKNTSQSSRGFTSLGKCSGWMLRSASQTHKNLRWDCTQIGKLRPRDPIPRS